MSSALARCKVDASPSEQMAQHEGLVRWVVRQQWLGGLPFDDALHEGRLGLWSALRGYDPLRGTAFSSYAVPAITRAVWHAVAIHHRPSCPTGLQLGPTTGVDPVDLVHRAQVHCALLDLVGQLPTRLREIVIAHYGLDHNPAQTFAAIGHTMGISRQRVHQLHCRAVLWLAHPAHSLRLRRLVERNRRGDYRQAIARQGKAARRGRQKATKRARL